MPGHLNPPAASVGKPAGEGASVGAVAPDQLQARQAVSSGTSHQRLCSKAVMQVGSVHVRKQDEAGGVHEKVPLAAGGALGGVPRVQPVAGPRTG